MSDEIILPVTVIHGDELVDANGYDLASGELKAAVHAINKHDALVEGIAETIEHLELEQIDYKEIYLCRCPIAEKLITKLKGLIDNE